MSASRPRSGYCLSYTAVLLNFLPCGSVPLVVTVRLLPLADVTIRPVTVTFPPFLNVNQTIPTVPVTLARLLDPICSLKAEVGLFEPDSLLEFLHQLRQNVPSVTSRR